MTLNFSSSMRPSTYLMPEDGAYRGLVAWNRRVEIRYDRAATGIPYFRIAAFN